MERPPLCAFTLEENPPKKTPGENPVYYLSAECQKKHHKTHGNGAKLAKNKPIRDASQRIVGFVTFRVDSEDDLRLMRITVASIVHQSVRAKRLIVHVTLNNPALSEKVDHLLSVLSNHQPVYHHVQPFSGPHRPLARLQETWNRSKTEIFPKEEDHTFTHVFFCTVPTVWHKDRLFHLTQAAAVCKRIHNNACAIRASREDAASFEATLLEGLIPETAEPAEHVVFDDLVVRMWTVEDLFLVKNAPVLELASAKQFAFDMFYYLKACKFLLFDTDQGQAPVWSTRLPDTVDTEGMSLGEHVCLYLMWGARHRPAVSPISKLTSEQCREAWNEFSNLFESNGLAETFNLDSPVIQTYVDGLFDFEERKKRHAAGEFTDEEDEPCEDTEKVVFDTPEEALKHAMERMEIRNEETE